MLITFFSILLIIALICSISKKDGEGREVLGMCCVCIAGLLLIAIVYILPHSVPTYERIIDEKISLYEEENALIESNINAMVSKYMQYESEVVHTFSPNADAMTMVMIYPELKADTLVQKQIEIMTRNNEQIKVLKEEKINIQKDRWIVYFGN